jgi:hypothetical protein
MNTHPANWREYWDRLIKLNQETGGNFTVEQLWETLGTTPKEIAGILEVSRMKPYHDDGDNYEAACDTIKFWEGNLISESYIEDGTNPSLAYRPPPKDSKRLEELRALKSMSIEDWARLKIEDRVAIEAARVKYITLLRESHAAERRERDLTMRA